MQTRITAADRARIEARYPRRNLSDMIVYIGASIVLVGVIALVAVAGLIRSDPPVVAMIRAFDVKDANSTVAEVVVQRKDPAQTATCFIYAQASNYERVGELQLAIPAGTKELTVLDVDLRTIREATSVSIENCRVTS